MQAVTFLVRLVALVIATLISLRVLFVMIQRVPGVVVAISAVAIIVFSISYWRGGMRSIGIKSRKASALAGILSIILLIISTIILINVK